MAPTPTIRPARPDDADVVGAFASDTWPEHGGDYLPRVFEAWVEETERGRTGDHRPSRTLVADVDGRAVGLLRTTILSETEAWCGGLRVDPDRRGEGIAHRLCEAAFDWARERGAAVARAMVFSWNAAGLGVARAVGFEPVTEFRWVHPEPASGGEADTGGGHAGSTIDPAGVWDYWRESPARQHLEGLALDPTEPWALSTLTRERLADAAEAGRLVAVGDERKDGDVAGFSVRVRTTERGSEAGGTTREAVYGVADWADAEAAAALLGATARDAATVDADRTRVLVPETVRAVSDVAATGVDIADSPDFVLAADLTG